MADEKIDITSPQSKSEEQLDNVSVPVGSEKVVQITKRSKHFRTSKSVLVNANTRPPASNYDVEAHTRKYMRHEKKHRSKHGHISSQRHSLLNLKSKPDQKSPRNAYSMSNLIFQPDGTGQPTMIGNPDMFQPGQMKFEDIVENDSPDSDRVSRRKSWAHPDEQTNFTFVKSKHHNGKEREVFVNTEPPDWANPPDVRYSKIFTPEYRKRHSNRPHISRTKSAGVYAVGPGSKWNIGASYPMLYCPNCMTNTCYRCRTMYVPQQRSASYDVLGMPPQNMAPEDIYDSPNAPRGSTSRYPGSSDNFGHFVWKNPPHAYNAVAYPMIPQPAESRPYPQPRSRVNLDEVDGYYENFDKAVDLLEIEYTSFADESTIPQLSLENLQTIYGLARKAITVSEQLEEIAENLKLALDAQLGVKWHTIVGVDSFGSNIESLPGALANLKIDKYVFLVWQT